ncbi:MAG: hypothetical protein H6672_14970 [Anaerolineaceae bacterium]|nr:hypothetical protein [Anaerolineaceae bacterium]
MSAYDSGGSLPPGSRSKYRRPRRPFSWIGLVLGLLIGIGGGLYYAWGIDPRVEFDTEPWQLSKADRDNYMVAIALDYAADGDLNRAIQRLLVINKNSPNGDPIQALANAACDLATTGYVDSSSGLNAIRAMMTFYQLQGRSGCADNLIPVSTAGPNVVQIDLPTPTPMPPASKTPTPPGAAPATATRSANIVPTSPPQRDFTLVNVTTDCSAALSGLIEVFVQDFNGEGVPGIEVRVRWSEGEDRFFTGLKPERGPAYADFQMEPDKGYTVELPGRSDPSQQLVARTCTTASGEEAIILYRVVFRPTG